MADQTQLYRLLIGARIRSDWQYRTSFLTLLVSQTMVVAFEFLALVFVVQLVPSLGGWTGTEVAFLYALATVPFGLADLAFSSVERTSDYVRSGEFDRILLRPLPALFQIWSLEFELRRLGKLLPPTAVGVWAVLNVDVDWTIGRSVVLTLALLFGTVMYSSLWIIGASMSFWAVATQQASNALTYGGRSANEYPLHLYRGWIRATLGWAVPLAFVAYIPTQWLLDAANPLNLSPQLIWTTPLVTSAVAGVAMACWSIGIRHYQSTGS